MAYTKRRFLRDGFCVAPRSEVEIRNVAEQVRKISTHADIKLFNVIEFLECKMPQMYEGFRYEIVEPKELPDREAEMNPSEFCIRIQEPIYLKAMEHDGRSRFTIAHELGHFFLHRHQSLAFGRRSENGDISPCRHSEWQADVFARNLLAPWSMTRNMTAKAIEVLFEVSHEVAAIIAGENMCRRGKAQTELATGPMLPGFEGL